MKQIECFIQPFKLDELVVPAERAAKGVAHESGRKSVRGASATAGFSSPCRAGRPHPDRRTGPESL
jgi:hypothetical protein